jgi:hypothetical protein
MVTHDNPHAHYILPSVNRGIPVHLETINRRGDPNGLGGAFPGNSRQHGDMHLPEQIQGVTNTGNQTLWVRDGARSFYGQGLMAKKNFLVEAK